MRGQHVMLLDADPQGSSLDWTQRRSQQGLPRLFSAVGLARETLHQEAPELARRADHVVIDGPPDRVLLDAYWNGYARPATGELTPL